MAETTEPKKFLEEDERKLRWELYGEHKKQTWQDIQSSTDSYDQSLLALSTGGLGLSIAFIKDLVPLPFAVWLPLLYVSWVLFILTILFTVASFLLSVQAQKRQLEFLWKFYLERDNAFRDKETVFSKALRWCTFLAGTFFLAAVVCTAVFAMKNIARSSKMSEPTKSIPCMDGRNTLPVTPVPQGSVQGNCVPAAPPAPSNSTPTQSPSAAPAVSQPQRKS